MVESVPPPADDGAQGLTSNGGASPVRAAHCESCGRFVGAYERCPYCGAHMAGRLDIRAVKLAAVLLATVGLALLWWYARRVAIPQISIREASGTMNLAYVRVAGRVGRQPTYDPTSGYLGFWLVEEAGDDTGDDAAEVHVSVYRDVLTDLLVLGKVPALGDEVTVAGTLRIRENHTALTVNVAEHLELRRPEARPRTIGEVTILDVGKRVRLTGDVRRVTRPYDGLTLITLGDPDGEIVVAVSDVVTALTGALPELVEGQTIRVDGVVTLYRSVPQIAPASVADIEPLPAAIASEVVDAVQPEPTLTLTETAVRFTSEPAVGDHVALSSPTPTSTLSMRPPDSERPPAPTATAAVPIVALGQLDAEDVGRWVRVHGRVVLLEGIKGGVKATLDDGTAQIILLVWDNIHRALEAPSVLDSGAEVDACGKVAVYDGALEVVPTTAADLTILVPAPPVDWVEIGALGSGDVGRVVRIRGVIGAPQPFSAGVKAPLDDGTGVISLLLWSNLYDALRPSPRAGQQVEVVGAVSLFRQELELVPRTIYDWRVGPPDG